MPKNKQSAPCPVLLLAVRILLIGALGVAGYLAWVSLSGSAVAGCGPDSNCHQVLNSRWAYWLGIPVSAIAGAVYAALLTATFSLGPTVSPERQAKWRAAIVALGFMVMGAALWFVGLQLIALKTICPFCIVAHACGLAASLMLLRLTRPQQPVTLPAKSRPQDRTPQPQIAKFALTGLAGVAVLIAGQLLYERPSFAVQSLAGTNKIVPIKPVERNYALPNGQFVLNLREVPIVGSPDAPKVLVSLFDYTCHHCRIMHGQLKQVHQSFSNQLVIVSLPMPLDSACNPAVKRTPAAHVGACEYARIGLAVWRVRRAVAEQFDDWVFEPEKPPSLAEVKQHAEKLVGKDALDRALADEWVGRQLQQAIAIYDANYQTARRGDMPQLIIGPLISFGMIRQVADLYRLLDQQLALRR